MVSASLSLQLKTLPGADSPLFKTPLIYFVPAHFRLKHHLRQGAAVWCQPRIVWRLATWIVSRIKRVIAEMLAAASEQHSQELTRKELGLIHGSLFPQFKESLRANPT